MSKILYILPLYGGAPDYMLTAMQKKMNEAMKTVTKRKWEVLGQRLTSTSELLKQCDYLSGRQMAYYHSVEAVHKLQVQRAPEYLHQVVSSALVSGVLHRYPTRTAGTRLVAPARLAVANSSFRWRASTQYAALPEDLKTEKSLQIFLTCLRQYTKKNVPI